MQIDFGHAPESWPVRALGDFCHELRLPAGKNSDLPILSVSKDLGILLQPEKFKRRIAADDTSRYKRVRHGEFAYDPMLLWSGSIARQERVSEGLISPAYYAFRVDDSISHDFLLQLFKWDRMVPVYANISVGTNTRRRKASFDAFCGLKLPLPPLPEQRKIAAILSSVDEAIQATEQVIQQTRRVKEGLLQELLTRGIGHTRFKQTPIGVVAVTPSLAPCPESPPGATLTRAPPDEPAAGVPGRIFRPPDPSLVRTQASSSGTDRRTHGRGTPCVPLGPATREMNA